MYIDLVDIYFKESMSEPRFALITKFTNESVPEYDYSCSLPASQKHTHTHTGLQDIAEI